ncbi:FUSC family membrane protein [Sphingobacterium sp. LRF_L2]|uniref:FUSC family protein n=1 Tax=Sphingobacterium sp. LRF_L2 TaxID=3369421 RepID=UPI003F63E085
MKAKLHSVNKIIRGLLAEYGAESFRTTISAMLPAVCIALIWGLDLTIPFVIGALNASMTDFPGSRKEKLRAALWGVVCAVSVSLIVGYSLPYNWLLILLIGVLGGFFTLFSALGPRLGMIGVTSLFLIAFVMGLKPSNILEFSFGVGVGTAWFYLVNLVHAAFDPLWELRRAISNAYRTTANLLRLKALCYDAQQPLDMLYHQVAAMSIKLADQQETVRHLLLRGRNYIKGKDEKEYTLWLRAYVLIDLYGMTTAIDHDYELIRHKLEPSGALAVVKKLVLFIADGTDLASRNRNRQSRELLDVQNQIEDCLETLKNIQEKYPIEVGEIIQGAIANARNFLSSITQLHDKKGDNLMEDFYARSFDFSNLLPPLSLGLRDMFAHIRSYSPLFLFSLRMLVLFLLGGLLGELLSDMKYTYWILITIIVVARPSYLLTQRRNKERLLGTMGGVCIGLSIIFIFSNTYLLLTTIGFLLFCFLLFNKRYYMISVFFITAMVIIALHLHNDNWSDVFRNRLIFTFLGCALAYLGWFLVPVRHNKNLQSLLSNAWQENNLYYKAICSYILKGEKGERYEIRLARKRAFLSLTKLSDAVLQSQKEPGEIASSTVDIQLVHIDMYRLHAMISSLWLQYNQENLTGQYAGTLENSKTKRIVELFAQLERD